MKHAEEIGDIVKTWREDKGMSYQEIANYLNGLGNYLLEVVNGQLQVLDVFV